MINKKCILIFFLLLYYIYCKVSGAGGLWQSCVPVRAEQGPLQEPLPRPSQGRLRKTCSSPLCSSGTGSLSCTCPLSCSESTLPSPLSGIVLCYSEVVVFSNKYIFISMLKGEKFYQLHSARPFLQRYFAV
jgi:hypothetical protein